MNESGKEGRCVRNGGSASDVGHSRRLPRNRSQYREDKKHDCPRAGNDSGPSNSCGGSIGSFENSLWQTDM